MSMYKKRRIVHFQQADGHNINK